MKRPPLLLRSWNTRLPSPLRTAEAHRVIRQNLSARPQGKGNRFWRRYCDTQRAWPVLIWPDYAVNPIPYRPKPTAARPSGGGSTPTPHEHD